MTVVKLKKLTNNKTHNRLFTGKDAFPVRMPGAGTPYLNGLKNRLPRQSG
jgi:hypothetical protein